MHSVMTQEKAHVEWTALSCGPLMHDIFFRMYGAYSLRLGRAISNIRAWNTSLGNWADDGRGWEAEKNNDRD